MPEPKPAVQLTLERARAACIEAQGLNEPAGKNLIQTLEHTGFVRTLGGVDGYLAMFCRVAGLKRADVDNALLKGEAKVIPAARGCMYVVPQSQVPLTLTVADLVSRAARDREQTKAGIEQSEVDAICQGVVELLGAKGPMTTDALRRALPEGLVRSLGPAGKKLGVSSPLPGAIRRLEFEGKVERLPRDARLDNEHYQWRIPPKNVFQGASVPSEKEAAFAQFASLYFRAAGLATVSDFAGWAGLSKRDATAAIGRAALVPVSIEGLDDLAYAPEANLAGLKKKAPEATAVSFLAFEDNIVALHGGPGMFVDAKFHDYEVPQWGGGGKTEGLGKAQHMSMRAMVGGNRIPGLWEYDPDDKKAVFACFDKPPAALRKRMDAVAEEVGTFLREDVGHGRSFSLDTDDELRKRVARLRTM